jgi:cytochrome P450
VPPELVVETATYSMPNDAVCPFSTTIGVHDDLPPVIYNPVGSPSLAGVGSWVVTHYADIREVYQNNELYSTEGAAAFHRLIGETFPMIPLGIDPPAHRKYRSLLNPWFSPAAVAAMEPQILATINELIDGFVEQGGCDASYDYGRVYPVRVFMDLMGFPRERFEEFLEWEYAILHSGGDLEKVRWGIGSAISYLRSFVEEVRAAPGENLTSRIVHGEVDGRPLTDDEIMGTVTFLWIGGLDTVAATTSLMFRRLAIEPELQQTLRDDPSLIPAAIEEFLRMQPLVNSSRTVKKDHAIRGVDIKAGDRVTAFNRAGNFDAEEFADPRTFRLDRETNRHFTLAGGVHRCLGSHLARLELGHALGEFLRRVPPFELAPEATRTAYPGLIAVPHLPLVWST